MTLAADLLTDLTVLFNTDEFAVSATYTPSGGTATTIKVIWDKDDGAVLGMAGTLITVVAKTSDVSAAKPKETIAIGGTTYKIKEPPIHSTDGTTRLKLTID